MRGGEPISRGAARGFTLLELIVVVALIAALASITIPNLLESRKAANEIAAVATLRALIGAQSIFRDRDLDRDARNDYADRLSRLRPLLDERLTATTAGGPFPSGTATSAGYHYGITVGDESEWEAFARPVVMGKTGSRVYHVDESGVIRFSTTDAAGDFALARTWFPIGD